VSPRRAGRVLLRLLALGAAAGAVASRADQPAASPPPAPIRGEAVARQACASCHAFPPPEILPRNKWNAEIFEMVDMAVRGIGAPNGQEIALDFPVEDVLAYYEIASPRELAAPLAWPGPANAPVPFARHAMSQADGLLPRIANVRLLSLRPERGLELIAVDMANGLVLRGSPARPAEGLAVLAWIANPCHVEAVDLDRDGLVDLLVANLGSVTPSDETRGSVVWLRATAAGGVEARTLAAGLPRVADARAADFDGDGDLDIVVAAFGWRQVGATLLLENRTTDWSAPVFVARELDGRQGAIHVPVIDLDHDGRLDFVGLISQHHETVVAFLGEGRSAPLARTIFAAPHPGWGASGIELSDLDRDGDVDVLITNGDMFDEFLLKPYHGITWLENRGSFPFVERPLAALSGVHRAQAGDLDGDGDLDVVACTLIPGMARYGKPLPSLVWLEQVAPGRFERHTLEIGGYHASLDVGDVDADGDLDIVTGTFQADGQPTTTVVDVWENLSARAKQPAARGAH
jgi:hypothetical protein